MTSVESLLEGKRIVICAGSGGVGKTTTAAALGLGMAERGLRVAVVTIDPARRLATSLGLEELGNEPRQVDPERLAARGVEVDGELWAMMLDAKRTFDALIERLAPDERTRDEVFANRIYQQLSSAVAGSQEFTAIAKLYELDQEGGFDLLVLDTPPSRNALDFLDAPQRLKGFFGGRAIRMFLRPAGLSGKVLGRGTGMVFSLLKRVTGVDLLQDLSVFFRTLGGMIDGFMERADRVGALLEDPATTFLIVTSPRHDPVRGGDPLPPQARRRGDAVRRPGGQPRPHGAVGRRRAAGARSPTELGDDLARRVGESAHELAALAARDEAGVEHLIERARLAAGDRRARARRRRPRRRRARAGARAPVRRA